ncbi:MAG TPA: hypothetical protein PKM72_04190, partial [Nitrospirales bacterium]|nr:hypothetical protein [Nitrospirales bacterium]
HNTISSPKSGQVDLYHARETNQLIYHDEMDEIARLPSVVLNVLRIWPLTPHDSQHPTKDPRSSL